MTPHDALSNTLTSVLAIEQRETNELVIFPGDCQAPSDADLDPPRQDDTARSEFTFPELIDQEVMGYRAWETPVGDFLAREMGKLARMVRWTDATDPEQYEARMEVWEDHLREQTEAKGFEEGRNASCRCGDCPVE